MRSCETWLADHPAYQIRHILFRIAFPSTPNTEAGFRHQPLTRTLPQAFPKQTSLRVLQRRGGKGRHRRLTVEAVVRAALHAGIDLMPSIWRGWTITHARLHQPFGIGRGGGALGREFRPSHDFCPLLRNPT